MPYREQTLEEAQTPEGYVYPLEVDYAEKPVMVFNPFLREMEYDHSETDYTEYVVMNKYGHYEHIKVGFCRFCKEKIKPYPEKFYKKEAESGFYISTEFSAKSQCCRNCAIEQTKKVWTNTVNWYVANRTRCGSLWSGDREVIEWENDKGDTSKEIICYNADYKDEL